METVELATLEVVEASRGASSSDRWETHLSAFLGAMRLAQQGEERSPEGMVARPVADRKVEDHGVRQSGLTRVSWEE
jgi:hypothetical protein